MHALLPPLHDKPAFGNLYDRTHGIIFRFIYGLHGGPVEEVEDITCETYMRAWKGRDHFHGDDQDALCWLFTIARHLVIDAHRSKNAHSYKYTLELDAAEIDAIFPALQPDPETQVAEREEFNHLWHALQSLPIDKRELLVLRYISGWKVNQISSFLHMEENTVSVYLRRIIKKIRLEWNSSEW